MESAEESVFVYQLHDVSWEKVVLFDRVSQHSAQSNDATDEQSDQTSLQNPL